MPAKFSLKNNTLLKEIKKYIFKTIPNKKFKKMTSTFATPTSPGFSYLYCYKEEHHNGIAELLKEGPTVKDVITFAIQNDRSYMTDYKIKAVLHDETRSILIEEENNEPIKPVRRTDRWEEEEEESIEDFQERVRLYNIEKEKWFTIKELFFFLHRNEMYWEYRFE